MKWSVPLQQKRAPIVEPISELNRIRIHDNGEPLVDALARIEHVDIHPDRKDYPQTNPYRFHGRLSVVEMLARAQRALPKGCHLRLWGIYRSLEEQIEIYEKIYAQYQKEHPEWPKNILRRQTNHFVHPPDIKTPPGHSTGGAVDLSLAGEDGEAFDMTSPFDPQSDERRKVAATFAPLLSAEARHNRTTLINAMSSSGFSNYGGEWWHWSYGDSCWAWRLKRRVALYGPVTPPQGSPDCCGPARTVRC